MLPYVSLGVLLMTQAGWTFGTGIAEGKHLAGRRQRPSWCCWLVQVYAKEEELCELQVKLTERDAALKAHKTENSRFADMKDKFKADIAALQQQVSAASPLKTKCVY